MIARNKHISSPPDARIMLPNVTSAYVPQEPENKKKQQESSILE